MPSLGFIYLFLIREHIWWRANTIPKSSLVFSLGMSWGREGPGLGNPIGLPWAAPQWWPFQTLNVVEFTTWREETCFRICHMSSTSLSWPVETFPRNPVARRSMTQVFCAQAWSSWTASGLFTTRHGTPSAVCGSKLASAVSVVMTSGHSCSLNPRIT